MEQDTRDHIAALTGGFLELMNILGQRRLIDAGDLGVIHDIMHHALRKKGDENVHEHAREQLAVWIARASELAAERIPLPPPE